MNQVPTLKLNDGHTIPQLGFGTYQIPADDAQGVVARALETGYRHLDTAQMYGNEREVGAAVAASGLEREEVFITSKLNNGFHKPDDARRSFDDTLKALGSDYIDLFLIHWPLPTRYDGDFVSTWQTLEEFKKDGRARSIGVSNFQVEHLKRLAAETGTVPAVNQIEVHPYFQNGEVVRYCQEQGIGVEAWSPLAQGGPLLRDAAVTAIAEATGKTAGQVVLRWHIQKSFIIFPKSTTPERIQSNFQLFDFELTDEQMRQIDGLDQGESGRVGPNPDSFDYVP